MIKIDRKYAGEELIVYKNKKIKAILVKAIGQPEDEAKEPYEFSLWLGSERTRRILKFSAKVKIGNVFGELVDYQVNDSKKSER